MIDNIELEREIEKEASDVESLSISESERVKKGKIDVELIEYAIISKYFDEENDNVQLIFLPTPEAIQKLINSKLIQDLIKYDINKYKLLFKYPTKEENNDEESFSEEKIYLDLDKISKIQDITMLSIILVFLGGINSQNDIYSIFPNETPQNPDEDCLLINVLIIYIMYIVLFNI